MREIEGIFVVLALMAVLSCAVSASTVYMIPVDGEVDQADNLVSFGLVLDEASGGLSGYILNLSVSDPSVATITDLSYPAWADLNYPVELPAGSCQLGAIDLDEELSPGTKNITLAKVTITGNRQGSADIIVKIVLMDDLTGRALGPRVQSGEIIVDSDTVRIQNVPIVTKKVTVSPIVQEIPEIEPDIKDEFIDVSEIRLPQLQSDPSQKKVVVEGELSPGKTAIIDGVEFTIPYGSIIYHDQSGITTVFDSSGVQLFSADDSEAKEVWAPGGPQPATHIHEAPSGSIVNCQGNVTYIISKKQVILVVIEEERFNEQVPETMTGSATSAPTTPTTAPLPGIISIVALAAGFGVLAGRRN